MEKFDTNQTWQELLSGEKYRPTIFTAVPTVFVKLIEQYEKTYSKDKSQVRRVRQICEEKMRLFLSGSASLPVPILEKFEGLSGHRILERYGMTETGLILCNPLNGERKSGFVGTPLQTVKFQVTDLEETDTKVAAMGNNAGIETTGEDDKVRGSLLVKGPSVFKEYWANPEATGKEFTKDGWFKTGDTVEFSKGNFKVLGRNSVDIIKSGGYKLSALEIETELLSLEQVREVAVVGIPDPTWGQKVRNKWDIIWFI